MQETGELEKLIEEIFEKRPDIILKALKNFLPADIATQSDLKLVVETTNKRFEDILRYSERQFEAINKRFEDMNRRFDETINLIHEYFKTTDKRFESVDKRFEESLRYSERQFEAINRRFEDMNKRFDETLRYSERQFEAMDRRFEELMHYADKKFDLLAKIIFSFNIPVLVGIIAILIKTFLL